MIPEEAFEAAAKRMAGAAYGLWELVPEPKQRLFLRDATLALEAAAPHLLAVELEAVAKDLWESAQIIQVRSHDAGIDNEGVIHAMKVDAALLRARAANHRSAA